VGDPFRYAEAAGADGSAFYDDDAVVTPVVFYDSLCARVSGRVWEPRGARRALFRIEAASTMIAATSGRTARRRSARDGERLGSV